MIHELVIFLHHEFSSLVMRYFLYSELVGVIIAYHIFFNFRVLSHWHQGQKVVQFCEVICPSWIQL